MEVSLTFLIETPNKALADFIGLMWDEENAPVENDEVAEPFRGAFEVLEFADFPEQTQRAGECRWLCYCDCLSDADIDEMLSPYCNIGVQRIIVVCSADEGEDWYSIDRSGRNNIRHSDSLNASTDEDDYFARLLLVANSVFS